MMRDNPNQPTSYGTPATPPPPPTTQGQTPPASQQGMPGQAPQTATGQTPQGTQGQTPQGTQGQTPQGTQGMPGQSTGTPPGTPGQTSGTPQAEIWESGKAEQFRQRWHDEVQTRFVEDPQASVADAKHLIDEAVQSLADNVHEREEQLARTGARTSDSTDGMREQVLQYHQILDRLLAV